MKESETPKDIDEYISKFPVEKLRATIRETAPDAVEKISYQMPTFALGGNLVHFAAYRNHIGFYPTPSGIENSVIRPGLGAKLSVGSSA